MKFLKKILLFMLISAVFLNSLHASASVSVITSFETADDFDTAYDFETVPSEFKVSEIITDTLGSQHTIKWTNPSNLDSNMKIEIYAVCDFSIYASNNWFGLVTWNEIESATDKDWQTVSTPYVKVYEGNASDKSCVIDFDSLMQYLTSLYVSNRNNDDGLGGLTSESVTMQRFLSFGNVLVEYGSSVLGSDYTDIVDMYTYTINGNECKDFKFSKMKYYIRYKEPVSGEDPLQEDGLYHYYFDGWQYFKSSTGGYLPAAISDVGSLGAYSASYTVSEEGENVDGATRWHVSYRVVSEYPLCFVLVEQMTNYLNNNENVYDSASKRYRGVDLYPYALVNDGTSVRQCSRFYSYALFDCVCDGEWTLGPNSGTVDEIVAGAVTDSNRRLTYQDTLNFLCTYAAFDTNIPIFSPVFSSAYEEYLFSGELDAGESGNSWMLPASGWLYGQLLQNTVAFADGGTSLDSSGSTTSVLDGDNDTDNGWLKKIYRLLKKNLVNEDGDSWLEKVHERLTWTNTWLKALIAENTIADLGSFVLNFLGEKAEGLAETLLDGVAASGITAAGETITAAASTRFPFSIYMDYAVLAAAFSADPAAPVFSVPLRVGKRGDSWLIDEKLDVDLSRFDGLAEVSRGMFYCLFIAGLVPATRKYVDMINGGKLL